MLAPKRAQIVAVLHRREVRPAVNDRQIEGVWVVLGGIAPPDEPAIAAPRPLVLVVTAGCGIMLRRANSPVLS